MPLQKPRTPTINATVILGEGGFGQVFAARAEDGREAAAKLVAKVPGAQRELLFVELGVARNIVPIIDSGETEDHWVLIMPMAERSLGQELQAANALPVEAALVVLTDIADALAGIDGRVVHRDLKPDNVLLLHGVWCLADFGISRYAEATTAPDTRKRALSPPYAAPERWRSERATSAADVYALGVIAYELLTGRLPFPGPTTEEFGDQHLHAEPPRLTGVSARLAGLIEECLYKAPGARPTPANLQARLAKAGGEPRLAGAAKLAGAYQVEAARVAEQTRAASLAQTEGARRAGLLDASRRGLRFISDQLVEHLDEAAPTAPVQRRAEGWNMSLNGARLGLSVVQPFDGKNWSGWDAPPIDVIGYATVSITIPADRQGYEGRSHSLYYCDANEPDSYAWYETAFMFTPGLPRQGRQDPFALPPGAESAKALWPGMSEYQVAWPFTRLVVGDIDDFLDRWLGWFAAAAQGQLQHPMMMPERPAEGTWRRGGR